MKTALIKAFGSLDVVQAGEGPLPVVQPGKVLVRVEAASVNPLDVKIIAGYMQAVFPVQLPYVPGTDFSGVIESVGERVGDLKPGIEWWAGLHRMPAVRSPTYWSSTPPNSASSRHK